MVTAFLSAMQEARRDDGHGRNVEILYGESGGTIVIYHAFTPPTRKFLREMNQLGRKS